MGFPEFVVVIASILRAVVAFWLLRFCEKALS
jgi:hypothetical protein